CRPPRRGGGSERRGTAPAPYRARAASPGRGARFRTALVAVAAVRLRLVLPSQDDALADEKLGLAGDGRHLALVDGVLDRRVDAGDGVPVRGLLVAGHLQVVVLLALRVGPDLEAVAGRIDGLDLVGLAQ